MSAQYDPVVLQKYADKLYSEASWVAFKYGFVYAFFQFIFSFIALAVLSSTHTIGSIQASDAVTWSGLIALVGFVIGVFVGVQKGFLLRLEAQRTLCQLQIEVNTRAKAAAATNWTANWTGRTTARTHAARRIVTRLKPCPPTRKAHRDVCPPMYMRTAIRTRFVSCRQ